MHQTDVCIIGAGPAGCCLSHFLSKAKIDHVLIDKASFPRDKVCGDGITVDVLNVLKRISPKLLEEFAQQSRMLPSWGFCFHGTNGKELRYNFKDDGLLYAPFYTSRRADLDNFLFKKLPVDYACIYTGARVTGIEKLSNGIQVEYQTNDGLKRVKTKILIGAEGEKPVVTRYMNLPHYRVKRHLIAALRVYYKNVKTFHPGNHLEFFFDKKLLPGYFWTFPLSDNEANVGLGMLSTAIAAKKINLKQELSEILQRNGRISGMLASAEPLDKPQGWGLPVITRAREIAGDHYALVGDAAGMIEPFTGKGIGPGMMSARICSEHIVVALRTKNYNLKAYQEHMYDYYSSEIKTGYFLQKSLRYPAVINTFIGLSNLSVIKKWSHNKMRNSWGTWM